MGNRYKGIEKLRVGEVSFNKNGTKATLIKYLDKNHVIVQFNDDYKYCYTTTYSNFKHGKLNNPYDKTLFNLGYIGVGKYKCKENGKNTKAYNCWSSMFVRCYDDENRTKSHQTYIGCTVCEEWHNFQVFAEWYTNNFYELKNEQVHIDKDILIKGNKVYSPDTCCFVPRAINEFFTKSNATRGELPIGVSKDINRNKYVATCTNFYDGKIRNKFFKRFNTIEEAFNEYKSFKEKCCIEIANYYKNVIPQKVYDALVNYKVDIND